MSKCTVVGHEWEVIDFLGDNDEAVVVKCRCCGKVETHESVEGQYQRAKRKGK